MENTICHFEIPVDDLNKAKEFYACVFDWKIFSGAEKGDDYFFIQTADDANALGGGLLSRADPEQQITLYIKVKDMDKTVERAIELGGEALGDIVALDGIGWLRAIKDPQGNRIGLFEKDSTASAAQNE